MSLSPEGVVEAFHRAVQADDEVRRVLYRAKVSADGGMVSLDELRIRTEHQRQGHGNRILTMLIDLCDANGLAIKVVPAPPENEAHCAVSVSRDDLIRWYENPCFCRKTKYIWIRKPRSLPRGKLARS